MFPPCSWALGIGLWLGRSGCDSETIADPVVGNGGFGRKAIELSHEALFAGTKANAQKDGGQRRLRTVTDWHERHRDAGPISPFLTHDVMELLPTSLLLPGVEVRREPEGTAFEAILQVEPHCGSASRTPRR
jgi:hypothetical protein